MTVLALQNAFAALAVLNPVLAFAELDREVAEVPEDVGDRIVPGDRDDDDRPGSMLAHFTLPTAEGGRLVPTMVRTMQGGHGDPVYMVADYADGTRLIELPEGSDALVRRAGPEGPVFAVLRHVNEPGKGFVPYA